VSIPVQQGGWAVSIDVRCLSNMVSVQIELPVRVAPGRAPLMWRQVGQLNQGLRFPGFCYTASDARLVYRIAHRFDQNLPSPMVLMDLAQTCISTSIAALPELAGAAVGPHASGDVVRWLEPQRVIPIAGQSIAADPLSDPLRDVLPAVSQHQSPTGLDWQKLAITGLLGRLHREMTSPWLAAGWTLVLQNDRCIGAWRDGRAFVLGSTRLSVGDWSVLQPVLQRDSISVVCRTGSGPDARLSKSGLLCVDEWVLVHRSLARLPRPDGDLSLAPVSPCLPLPELAALVPEVPANIGGGSWVLILSNGVPIGLALVHTDPVEGVGSLGFFGLSPKVRGRGIGARCHRLLLFALSGYGCREYTDGTSSDNHTMLKVFVENDCSESRRIRTYRRSSAG
jgi:RimJ/RimL family protein N-acetyltransferase